MAHDEYDLLIVGAGPGGYVAAVRAAQLGLETAIIEKDDRLGGTCLLRGCIPTKAMLHAADLLTEIAGAKRAGVRVDSVEVDYPGVLKAKEMAVTRNSKGVDYLMKKNGVDVVRGRARLAGKDRLELDDGRVLRARRGIVLAMGSRPKAIGAFPVDGEHIITSDQILERREIPSRLAILGAGAVGVEFASVFSRFGSKVVLLEMLPRILPLEDEELSSELARSLRKQGIEMRTSATLKAARVDDGMVKLTVAQGDEEEGIETDVLLVAAGRSPNVEDCGLKDVGVELKGGFVVVDEHMRTTVDGVWAIGDLVDTPQLAHVASAEGIVAVETIAGAPTRPLAYDKIPSCTYCHPEVASVGLSEEEARQRGHEVEVGRFPWAASGKARILGASEGFVKIVREKRYDEILGVHIIGPHATDLIGEACALLGLEATNEELGRIVHPHPTLSEAMMEASHAAAGHPLGM